MPKSDKKTKTEASTTNSTKKKKDKKKRTPTRSTDRTGKEPSTPEKKNKRSKSKSSCKGTPPPTGGPGKYRDKTSPEDTPQFSAFSRADQVSAAIPAEADFDHEALFIEDTAKAFFYFDDIA